MRGVDCSFIEEPPKNEGKINHPKTTEKSHIWGAATRIPTATKFLHAVQCLIMHVNFYEDSLKGFGMARGRNLAFSIDLLRRH